MAAALRYLHGVEVIEVSDGIRPIQTLKSAVIGIVGTAPDADPEIFPINEPVLLIGDQRTAQLLGSSGTLLDAMKDIYSIIGATVVLVRVEEGENDAETLSNVIGNPITKTGVWALMTANEKVKVKPRLLCAPGFTGLRPTDGIASVTVNTGGANYDPLRPPKVTFQSDSGYGAEAVAVIQNGHVNSIIVTNPGHGYASPPTVTIESTAPTLSVQAGEENAGNGTLTLAEPGYSTDIKAGRYVITCTAAAQDGGTFSVVDPNGDTVGEATVGLAFDDEIKFTIADGEDDFEEGDTFFVDVTINGGFGATATAVPGAAANPVGKALEALAMRLRAIAFLDGPNTTNEAAVQYRGDYGSDRVMILDPYPLVWSTDVNAYVARPGSPLACALQCRIDNENGFWHSFSNKVLPNIGGISRPISWEIDNPDTDANYLNENRVTTIVRTWTAQNGGFRFWGVRTTASDPVWTFMSVRRTADMIYESIIDAFLWIVDQPISPQLLEDAVRSVQAYLRLLTRRGATLGGDAWLDVHLNTKEELASGKLSISFDFEPPAPVERLTFHAHRNIAYYDVLLEEVIRELSL